MTAEQFESLDQEREARRFGLWIVLLVELTFFAGMLVASASYRVSYPADFASGSARMDRPAGTLNTGVLLTSSFWMALAIEAAEERRRPLRWLLSTAGCGAVFLAIKLYEYVGHVHEHLAPGWDFGLPPGQQGPFEQDRVQVG